MKIRNYIHFIIDFKLWPHLIRITIRKIKQIFNQNSLDYEIKIKRSRETSTKWCQENSIDINDLKIKLGIKKDTQTFEKKFKNEILKAKERVKESPFKMGN